MVWRRFYCRLLRWACMNVLFDGWGRGFSPNSRRDVRLLPRVMLMMRVMLMLRWLLLLFLLWLLWLLQLLLWLWLFLLWQRLLVQRKR